MSRGLEKKGEREGISVLERRKGSRIRSFRPPLPGIEMILGLLANRKDGDVGLVGRFDEARVQDLPGGLTVVFKA